MNRPVSGSDFGFQIPLHDGLHTIVDGLEYDDRGDLPEQIQLQAHALPPTSDSMPPTYESAMMATTGGSFSSVNGNGTCQNLTPFVQAERRLQHQISSGVSTQQYDSREEATYTESIELRLLGQYNSTDTDPYANDQRSGCGSFNRGDSLQDNSSRRYGSEEHDEAFLKYQKSLLTRSPSYRKSLDRLSQSSGQSQRSLLKSEEAEMRRHSSGQSLNSMSIEQDELLSQQGNLREELLNCDQKELFQFLQEEEELQKGTKLRRISNVMRSRRPSSQMGQPENETMVEHSEFDNIIQSFEKELEEIKRSTTSLERKLSNLSEPSPAADEATKAIMEHIAIITGASERSAADEVVLPLNPYDSYDLSSVPRRSQSVSAAAQRQSVKLKRRSLEKQRKIDEDFSISNEIRKICDQIHAPFVAMEAMAVAATSASQAQPNQSPFLRRKVDPFTVQFDRFKRLSLIERVEEVPEEEKPISTLRIESEKMPRKFLHGPDQLRLDSLSLKSTNSYENLLIQKQKLGMATPPAVPATPPTSLKSSIEPPTLAQISSLKTTPPLAALTEHQQHFHATSIQAAPTPAHTHAHSQAHAHSMAGQRRRMEHPQSTLDKAASFQSARTESHSSGAADASSALALAMAQKTEQSQSTAPDATQKPSAFTRLTEKPWHCLVSYVDDLTVGGRRNSQGAYNDPMTFPSYGSTKAAKVPDDCFPQKCYDQ